MIKNCTKIHVINGIEQLRPDDYQQAKIGKIIHNLASNRYSNKDRKELVDIIDDFEKKERRSCSFGLHRFTVAHSKPFMNANFCRCIS